MNFSLIDWLIFIAVPLLAWIVGNAKRQTGTWRGYFLATGSLQTSTVAATYFGANLTFTAIFLILSEEGYRRGVWAFSVPFFWFVGTVAFVVVYPRMKEYIKQGMTLHQTIGSGFQSPSLQRWASLWTILAFVGTAALEFYGGIKLLQWANVPLLANLSIAFLLVVIVSTFTVAGGFRGVAWADIVLDIFALASTIILFVLLINTHTPSNTQSAEQLLAPMSLDDNILFAIGMALIFIPFQFCTLDSWQRLGAWEKRNQSPTSLLLIGGFLLSLCYCVPILIGMVVREKEMIVPSGSHPLKVFMDNAHITPGLLGLVFAGFIAAVFSTVDELLNCCSLSLLFDLFQIERSNERRTPEEESKLVTSGKFYTAVFAVAAALIAVLCLSFEKQISDLALAVFSGQIVFIFPLFIILFRPQSAPRLKRIAVIGMLCAYISAVSTVGTGWMLHDKNVSDAAPLVAFLVAGMVFLIGSFISPKGANNHDES